MTTPKTAEMQAKITEIKGLVAPGTDIAALSTKLNELVQLTVDGIPPRVEEVVVYRERPTEARG